MSEQTLQIIESTKILLVGTFAYLYGRGGVHNKALRRIFGSLTLTTGVVLYSLWLGTFNYLLLSYALLLYASLSIGYGADDTKTKLIKRSRYGLAAGVAALPIAITTASWALFGLHIFLCILVSVTLGVWNITRSARAEETLIGATIGLLPLYMV